MPILVGDEVAGSVADRRRRLLSCWDNTDMVVGIGDRFLCWVNYLHGFLLWDTAAVSSPNFKLRYVQLPAMVTPPERNPEYGYGQPPNQAFQNMSAAAGTTGTVRLVSVDHHCHSTSTNGRYGFTVTDVVDSELPHGGEDIAGSDVGKGVRVRVRGALGTQRLRGPAPMRAGGVPHHLVL